MIEQLAAVVAIPALIAGLWMAVGLRAAGSKLWPIGALAAALLAGALILIAAFLPLIGFFGALGVPALAVGGGALLLLLFSRLQAVAVALSVPFAFAIVLNPAIFPLLMPFILVLPTWVSGWLERDGGAGRYALTILAALVIVPAMVFGPFFLLRGQG